MASTLNRFTSSVKTTLQKESLLKNTSNLNVCVVLRTFTYVSNENIIIDIFYAEMVDGSVIESPYTAN